nr:acetone carboxylase subunit gamma [Actinoplanes subtropicus]
MGGTSRPDAGPQGPGPLRRDDREFLCPVSGTVLDVDCVPPTFPVEVDFTPDLAAFYGEWLRRDLPVALCTRRPLRRST